MWRLLMIKRQIFFYLTAHSDKSAEEAIQLVNSWAASIIGFTRDLQRSESLDMLKFLESQINQLTQQKEKVDRQILDFAQNEQFVDENLQVESALGAMENLPDSIASGRNGFDFQEDPHCAL